MHRLLCSSHSFPVPYPAPRRKKRITSSTLRETFRPGAPGTAHPSSSRSQANATQSFTVGNPPLAAKLREFLKRKPPTPITKPRMQVLHQPHLTTLHPDKGFWRGGHALSLLMQFIIKQPASLQRGTTQVFRRVNQVSQEDR